MSALKPLVVFAGINPGVYTSWGEARGNVLKVKGSIYVRYDSADGARRAYDYARSRGWTRKCQGGTWTAVPPPVGAHALVAHGSNPLRMAGEDVKWYCVYRGLIPGVYESQ